MNARQSALLFWVATTVFQLLVPAAMGMEFQATGDTIYARGDIVAGDADRLAALLESKGWASDFVTQRWVQLASNGGNLIEGIKLGDLIHEDALSSLVGANDTCASACAIAFLGGTKQYATGTGVSRNLQYGAMLGFHGFSFANDKVALLNDTLETSRVINALILEYADRVHFLDKGWLAEALTVSPNDLHWVRTPADLLALSINVIGMPTNAPSDWAKNICSSVVGKLSPGRVLPDSTIIPTIRRLRQAIVAGRFGDDPMVSQLAPLSDSDAIDLVLGQPFLLDMRKPILDARIVPLDRGGGFYFDDCIAVRSRDETAVILTDPTGKRLHFRNFDGSQNQLSLLPPDESLW